MFFLKIEEKDLKYLVDLNAKKGMPIDRLARLAFLTGLRQLMKNGTVNEQNIPVQPAIVPLINQEKTQSYIGLHWQEESDDQMAVTLGIPKSTVSINRYKMGLLRARGRPNKTVPENNELRLNLFEKIDLLITEHWETKDDSEIGRLMDPKVSGDFVRSRRFSLKLKKKVGFKREKKNADKIEPIELERMLIFEGYTLSDYLSFKGINLSRERLRQIAENLGVKHSPEDRDPMWKITRRARQLGNINLANKAWLEDQMAVNDSMLNLAAKLGINEYNLFFFIRSFQITHPSFRKYGTQTVELVCTGCNKPFKRLKRWVDKRKKTSKGENLEYFCGSSCNGLYNMERARNRTELTPKQIERSNIRATKKQYVNKFITDNWESISDVEIGVVLKLATATIEHRRAALGLRRR